MRGRSKVEVEQIGEMKRWIYMNMHIIIIMNLYNYIYEYNIRIHELWKRKCE